MATVSKRNIIEVSDDEDDVPIYQPFRGMNSNNHLRVPNEYDRNSISSRDSRTSTSSRNSWNSGSKSPSEDTPLKEIDRRKQRPRRPSSRSNSPSVSRSHSHDDPGSECTETNCEICQSKSFDITLMHF